MCHPERSKKFFLEIGLERHARHLFDREAGDVDSHAVGPAGARLKLQCTLPNFLKLCRVSC